MMQFLRKHQKKLFLVITIMTIASFTFFGAVSVDPIQEISNKKIGIALDGSAIYERDLKALTQLLSLGASDLLRSDFFETGVIPLLAEKHFGKIEEEFEAKLQKVRSACFYSHPEAPFLNAVRVWNQVFPQLACHLQEVRSANSSAKTFGTYAQLYLDQQLFPPEMLRAVLLYEQQNYPDVPPDYQLRDARQLALFGHQTFEEWFGPSFSELLGRFILNTAALAEKKGYKVSQKEARADLGMNYYQAAKARQGEVTHFMRQHLQMMGVDESRASRLWGKVMLVHRFFQDLEQGVLLDSLAYETFSSFAEEKVSVVIYQLPEVLRLKDFQTMLKVQYYLEAISPTNQQTLGIPNKFYTVNQVEKKHPQLIGGHWELDVTKVSLEEITSRLGLKQIWDFETSLEGWALLTKQFPRLHKIEELDHVDERLRLKIDHFASQCLVRSHPKWIEEALSTKAPKNITAFIRSKGSDAPFDDIEETETLLLTLQKAEIGQTILFASPSMTYYQIKVLEKPQEKRVITLEEALKKGYLDQLLDERLEAALTDARKKEPDLHKDHDGSWKSFATVKNEIGAYVYADLLKLISPEPLNFDQYGSHRFEKVMREAQQSIQKESQSSPFLAKSGHLLVDQWKLIQEEREIKRSDFTPFSKSEMFSKPVGSWSSLQVSQEGNLSFFHLLNRESASPSVQAQVYEGQKLIGRDCIKKIIESLLEDKGTL